MMRLQLDLPELPDCYESPSVRAAWFHRTFPSLSFYARAARVVFTAASLAKRGRYDDVAWCQSSHDILRGLERVGVRVTIENLNAVLAVKGPCLIVGNHMSTLETFVLPYLIAPRRAMTFVVKKGLVEYPVFKHVMLSRDPIVVGRENPREDLKTMIQGSLDRLAAGVSIVVFPQTTRMTKFDAQHFNSIGVKIAKKAGVPVVPLALKTDAWSNGRILKDFGAVHPEREVRFAFGTPMEIEGNGNAQQASIVEHIESNLARWTQEAEQRKAAT